MMRTASVLWLAPVFLAAAVLRAAYTRARG